MMTIDSNEASGTGRKPPKPGIGAFIWIVVLVVILFALAHAMVHHRFHRGGRANPNGTIGP
jgi:hypothetical protein